MKTHHSKNPNTQPPGFALIVTLSMMILLTVIAVGLLSLAGVSLRTSSHENAGSIARNNARLSLMLAIGELQKQMGPDTRISVTSDQLANIGSPETPLAPEGQRHWTGIYQSWPAALPSAPRPEPQFIQWLVSGDPDNTETKDYATSSATSNTDGSVEIVSHNTVGPGETVRVPKITQTFKNGTQNGFAWWVGDQGVKALIAPPTAEPATIAETRADLQFIPTTNLQLAKIGNNAPFAQVKGDDENFARVHSWKSAGFLAGNDKAAEIGGLFHDFATQNRGLLINVRKGGFRKDLSMELEKPSASQPNPTSSALYTVGGEPGINLQELWAYYNICSTSNPNLGRGLKWSASTTPFTTGGSMTSKTPSLELAPSINECQNDDLFFYKQPVIINYQLALSFEVRQVTDATTKKLVNRLHVVTDPIVTFWNPLDVPVVIPAGIPLNVKYWSVPYTLKIRKGGVSYECPVASISKGDSNFLSLEMGTVSRLVFRPGEVIVMSQKGNLLASNRGGVDIHKLAGDKGFSYGQGVAWEATSLTGEKIDLAGGESAVFESAAPNNLTAGKTNTDGNIIPGGEAHKRHYSITHHEYYVGKDRGSNTESLGIGGVFLDYDFGNKRLGPNEVRAETQGGTKPSNERYYADKRPSVFPTFKDNRTIPSTVGTKMPFMLFSFNVKTENGAKLPTRSLSRFNPKALHVDFYDLLDKEREMLPYEYSVEILNGWKSSNDSLQLNGSGQGFFGAAWNAGDGSNFVVTHSVPREPIISLAAFQHSFANGFNMQKPRFGYGILNAREPLLPQISHAIGNSLACPIIKKDKTSDTLPGGRPVADHSYLANQALFDDYFLSGIAPQSVNTFPKNSSQKQVATNFFTHAASGKPTVSRYVPNTRGIDPSTIVNNLITTRPKPTAAAEIASYIKVEGLFNVNSTSIEAWKSLLGSRSGRKIVIRDANGKESIPSSDTIGTPVSGLLSPANYISKGSPATLNDPSEWTGYRMLSDDEIDSLARGIVKEVRKRGPFISLADFINRRVGNDDDLARSGPIQSALDSNNVSVNKTYNTGSRASASANNMEGFNAAEKGPKSYGIPGIVKQADILTPIAPILSARSDSFIIRGYGEKTDSSGKVIARAWCEAVVERGAEFVDSEDAAEKAYDTINQTNEKFGRKFQIISFRWLNPSEA